MLTTTLRCSILTIVLLNAVRGSPPSARAELNGQHSTMDALRQAKSEQIRRYMNESVDPCEDFYEFTCGNYITYNPKGKAVPLTMPSVTEIQELVDAQVMAELQTDDAMDRDVDKIVKNFYKSCLNMKTKTAAPYADKLFSVLKVFDKMPALMADKWQESDFDWVTTVGEIVYHTGIGTLFGIGAEADFTNNTIIRVRISEPKFFVGGIHLYGTEEYASARFNYIHFVAFDLYNIFGVEKYEALQSAEEILDFEIALAQGKINEHLGLESREIYNLTTIDEMQNKYLPDLDARQLLSSALDFIPNELYVDHRYVENALNVLKKTPKRVVANYMLLTLFNHFNVENLLGSSDLHTNCVDATQARFYQQLDNMLYRKHITDQMHEDLDAHLQGLKSAFEAVLQSPRLSWMQEDTRKSALEKLDAMKLFIADDEDMYFDRQLSQLQLNEDDYLGALVSLAALHGRRIRDQVPVEGGKVASYVASYWPNRNCIKLPVTFVQQYYMFSSSYPNAVNFATIGADLGHEMIHGFDDAGGKYDANGNNRNWWNAHTQREFHDRKKCLINQYKGYTINGRPLPEVQLQAENIADLGGIRVSYAAYLKWLANAVANNQTLESESLAGLNYTNKQLFFISYGQVWCDYRDTNMVDIDTHAPPKFRVIGPLSNFAEFSKEFKCAPGSAMNPVEKCEIY